MSRHVTTYSPAVRVGNWNEDVYLEEGALKDFIAKKENGQLLIQRVQNILDTFLKKTELSATQDGFVHFGDKIMLVNPGQEVVDVPHTQLDPARLPMSLSINAHETMLYNDTRIRPPVELSASRILNPCKRNTFIITSVDGTPEGETLCFGQPFTLSTLPGYTSSLKMWSDHIRLNQRSHNSCLQMVTLVSETTYMCVWNAQTFDPMQRLETEGLPIPANAKVVITHGKTGQKLSMLTKVHLKTPFGREYEVVAKTMLNHHNAEKDFNHWAFVTANPKDSATSLEQRVRKNVVEDEEVNKMQGKDDARKHWEHPKPDDEEPTCTTYCCVNAKQ